MYTSSYTFSQIVFNLRMRRRWNGLKSMDLRPNRRSRPSTSGPRLPSADKSMISALDSSRRSCSAPHRVVRDRPLAVIWTQKMHRNEVTSQRENPEPLQRLPRSRAVLQATGLTRSTVYRLLACCVWSLAAATRIDGTSRAAAARSHRTDPTQRLSAHPRDGAF